MIVQAVVEKAPATTPIVPTTSDTLSDFLDQWDREYLKRTEKVPLFQADQTTKWSDAQKRLFAGFLYHQRAHFDDVLWLMGSFSNNPEVKKIVLGNTRDEFGENGLSHEILYLRFAESLGLDLKNEKVEQNYYLPFLKNYNKGHIQWLNSHDEDHRLVAFSAIERLDNADYSNLKNVASNIGATGKALIFFNVHIVVEHFQPTLNLLSSIWEKDSSIIKNTFNFIGDYQIDIWHKLSDAIFHGVY